MFISPRHRILHLHFRQLAVRVVCVKKEGIIVRVVCVPKFSTSTGVGFRNESRVSVRSREKDGEFELRLPYDAWTVCLWSSGLLVSSVNGLARDIT